MLVAQRRSATSVRLRCSDHLLVQAPSFPLRNNTFGCWQLAAGAGSSTSTSQNDSSRLLSSWQHGAMVQLLRLAVIQFSHFRPLCLCSVGVWHMQARQ